MSKNDEAMTVRAKAIASQVIELKVDEVLVIRLPEGMTTNDEVFGRFREELKNMLPGTIEKPIRALVLRADMQMDSAKPPEELFESGPLRSAAKAAWASLLGNAEEAASEAHNAVEGLREETKTQRTLQIEHSTSRLGGPR